MSGKHRSRSRRAAQAAWADRLRAQAVDLPFLAPAAATVRAELPWRVAWLANAHRLAVCDGALRPAEVTAIAAIQARMTATEAEIGEALLAAGVPTDDFAIIAQDVTAEACFADLVRVACADGALVPAEHAALLGFCRRHGWSETLSGRRLHRQLLETASDPHPPIAPLP